jgi:hypothetical protein
VFSCSTDVQDERPTARVDVRHRQLQEVEHRPDRDLCGRRLPAPHDDCVDLAGRVAPHQVRCHADNKARCEVGATMQLDELEPEVTPAVAHPAFDDGLELGAPLRRGVDQPCDVLGSGPQPKVGADSRVDRLVGVTGATAGVDELADVPRLLRTTHRDVLGEPSEADAVLGRGVHGAAAPCVVRQLITRRRPGDIQARRRSMCSGATQVKNFSICRMTWQEHFTVDTVPHSDDQDSALAHSPPSRWSR